jgi:hypothetical protein
VLKKLMRLWQKHETGGGAGSDTEDRGTVTELLCDVGSSLPFVSTDALAGTTSSRLIASAKAVLLGSNGRTIDGGGGRLVTSADELTQSGLIKTFLN